MVVAEPVVALLRGAGCVVKDVLDGKKHWLMEPVVGKVTAIETVIAPTQFAAILFQYSAVATHFASRAYKTYFETAPTESQWSQAVALAGANGASPAACEVVKASLAAHFAGVKQKDRVMLCKSAIGGVFVLLTLLTLHIPYLSAVHWALLFVEIALLFLLTVMFGGVAQGWQAAGDKRRLAAAIEAGATSVVVPASLPLLVGPVCGETMPTAPWDAPLPAADAFGTAAVREHVKAVHTLEMSCTSKLKSGANKVEVAATLRSQASAGYQTAVLDFVLFFLNVLAFVGYAAYPVTYFFSEAYVTDKVPVWPGHGPIVYGGNLLGDVCWTIEPFLMLTVPLFIEKAAAVQRAAVKKDK